MNRNKIGKVAIATSLMLLGVPCLAQAPTAEPGAEAAATLKGGPVNAPDRIVSTGDSDFTPSADITTEDEQVSANFALDFVLAGDPKRTEEKEIGYVESSFWNGSIKASVPIGGGKEPSINFKNVGVNGKLTFNISNLRSKFASSESSDPYKNEMAARCTFYAGSKWIEDKAFMVDEVQLNQQLRAYAQHYSQKMKGSITPWEEYLVSWDDLKVGADPIGKLNPKDEFEPVYEAILAECKPGGPIGDNGGIVFYFKDNYPRDPEYLKYRKSVKSQTATFFGVEGNVGVSRFELLDRTNFTKINTDKVGFDINAHYGWIFNNADTAVRIGGGYARSFEAQDKAEFCRPIPASANQECIEAQDGLPTRKNTGYLEVGLRQILDRTVDGSPKIAVAPVISYDIKENDFQIAIPLYLQRNKDGGLDAGVRALYNSGKDDFSLGVFIGIPFDLIAR